MTDYQFTEGQRVYHSHLAMYGTYVARDDLDTTTSYVAFDNDPDYDDGRRITTAQLVPAEEVDA